MEKCKQIATQIRVDSVKMTNAAHSGHVGSMLSMAEIVAVLYEKILKVDPKNPKDPNRDRFILSKGHAAAGVYSALAQKGFIPTEWLSRYYCDDGKLMGHISHKVPGVEFSTGSLGHGLPVAVGMAIAARYAKSDRRVFCMTSDGDMNEGSTWEAIMFAAQEKLDNLILILDYNKIQALGFSKDIEDLSPLATRMENFGWAVREVDGHSVEELYEALSAVPFEKGKPSFVIAHTVKAKGIDYLENTVESHYRFVPDEKIDDVIAKIRGDVK